MKLPNWRNLKIEYLWVIAVLAGVFVFVNTQPIRPHDFWWHMAIGREIASTGTIPIVDEFSYTMQGTPYPSYQMFWLADIGLYSIYQLGEPALVIFVQSVLITATYSLLLWLCWKLSQNLRIASLATIFAVVLGINNWNVRPQTISYFLGALFLVAIYSYRMRPQLRWLAIFPLGMLVWVNSHGSFVIGYVLIGIWVGDEVWRLISARYQKKATGSLRSLWVALGTFGASLVVSLINPRGLGIVNYVSSLTSDSVVQNLVPEWASPSFGSIYGIFFFTALMVCAIILAISPKRASFFQLATFFVFGLLSLRTTRGVIWFGLVMAPVIAEHLNEITSKYPLSFGPGSRKKRSPIINLAILVLLFVMVTISLPWFKDALPLPRAKAGLVSSETPVEATNFLLAESLPGELFHDMGFGSYLIWAAGTEIEVFADPRIELYPREIWWDYVALLNALPGWEELLSSYEIRTLMLIPGEHSALIDEVDNSSNWELVYEDESAIVFTRLIE